MSVPRGFIRASQPIGRIESALPRDVTSVYRKMDDGSTTDGPLGTPGTRKILKRVPVRPVPPWLGMPGQVRRPRRTIPGSRYFPTTQSLDHVGPATPETEQSQG